ncbi:MAG: PTS sugar transporter subunit IIA [Thermoanaerobaculales bacterium]|jgi:mannitol/fructose-specific phosphotransferase system IIA component (Ntr-type)|nr:PTS sugar transporter subunit IIA [Thermoanaerobaculales bacterium]
MKIRDAVRPELVFLELEAEDADGALDAVSGELARVAGLDAGLVKEALTEREGLGSTSVGNGFAIPHCKLAKLEEIVVAVARFRTGVDFGNGKGHEPVRYFFVVLSPPDQPAEHLQVLSQIARVLKNGDLREALARAADGHEAVAAIRRAGDAEGL